MPTNRITKWGTPIELHCPIDFGDEYTPYVVRLSKWFDDEGCERGKRINGFDQCPKCGLWWPCEEEPDCWEESDDGTLVAIGWWGASVCCDCNLLLVTQPDGTPEAYQL